MNESSAAAHVAQLLVEPPLSPSSPSSSATVPRPAPAPAPERTSVVQEMRCYRLLSSEQLAQALREAAVEEKSVFTVALEHGWITRDDVSQPYSDRVAPRPVPEPVELEPEVELEVVAPEAALVLELSNGERIVAGRFSNVEAATAQGRQLAFKISHEQEWPLFDGRYVRPDAIVAIAVETLES
jgi:hypothetical protein